ncbi:DUF1707 SHOCT-like domain-containing protein [Actinomadura harenae]|uniref:DUF1707 domain-containing protein n=1 Tax=Actinomadura harenae TaxID=2483351 RepID=A0A3M2LBD1_9ACTN|nr:DUF1707 domain-containing protein [Actinomadura harenae]RMI33893.1 DUF1707 domain-containing protein [Actinomadura harenae]
MSDEPSKAASTIAPQAEAAPPLTGVRASDHERDQMLVRLHGAFAEGRLSEPELDDRIARTLAARTLTDLDVLAADLPEAPRTASGVASGGTAASGGRFRGRFQLAYKSAIRRGGRWRLPERQTTVVYKGSALIDLRDVDFESAETTLRVVAYKSRVTIIVPPGARVDAGGLGVSTEVHADPAPGGPSLTVKGLAYKGAIDIVDRAGEAGEAREVRA